MRTVALEMSMRIENLANRDDLIEEVGRLHHEEWGHLRPEQTLEDRAEKLRQFSGRGEIPTAFVATSNEGLLGTAMLIAHDMQSRPDLMPWLAGVYVKPEHRRTGVAAELIDRVAEAATRLGVTTLYLHTVTGLESFYTRLGWSPIEYCEYKGLNVVIMSRTL